MFCIIFLSNCYFHLGTELYFTWWSRHQNSPFWWNVSFLLFWFNAFSFFFFFNFDLGVWIKYVGVQKKCGNWRAIDWSCSSKPGHGGCSWHKLCHVQQPIGMEIRRLSFIFPLLNNFHFSILLTSNLFFMFPCSFISTPSQLRP